MNYNTLLISIICWLIGTQSICSQNIKREKLEYEYVRLPKIKIPKGIKSYRFEIKTIITEHKNILGYIQGMELSSYTIKSHQDYMLPMENYNIRRGLISIKPIKRTDISLSGYQYLPSKLSEIIIRFEVTKGISNVTITGDNVSYFSPEIVCQIVDKSGDLLLQKKLGNEKEGDLCSLNKSLVLHNCESDIEIKSFHNLFIQIIDWAKEISCQKLKTHNLYPYYVNSKKDTIYNDLILAKDYYMQAMGLQSKDYISVPNQLHKFDNLNQNLLLTKSILIWESNLALADYDGKDVKINEKVAADIQYNLILAYLWIGNYNQALKYCTEPHKGFWGKDATGLTAPKLLANKPNLGQIHELETLIKELQQRIYH